jgi:formylglycine-generating enzyme required for sulfatase activity
MPAPPADRSRILLGLQRLELEPARGGPTPSFAARGVEPDEDGVAWDPETGLPVLARCTRTGAEYAWMPEGNVRVGWTGAPEGSDEGPTHRMPTEALYLGTSRVTWGDLAAWEGLAEQDGDLPSPGDADAPALGLPWMVAWRFVLWRDARLPKEPELERALRGDRSQSPYPWPDTRPDPAPAWTAFGIRDWEAEEYEWCREWYHPNLYQVRTLRGMFSNWKTLVPQDWHQQFRPDRDGMAARRKAWEGRFANEALGRSDSYSEEVASRMDGEALDTVATLDREYAEDIAAEVATYGDETFGRSVRRGAAPTPDGPARCTARHHRDPERGHVDVGFRVAIPVPSSLAGESQREPSRARAVRPVSASSPPPDGEWTLENYIALVCVSIIFALAFRGIFLS